MNTEKSAPKGPPAVMADYDERQAAREARLRKRAEKLESESVRAYEASREALPDVPFGQPILVGHHSERKHRRALERSDAHTRRSIELDREAEECRAHADAVGTGGISTNDPEAIDKLREELRELEAVHKKRKAVNRIIRKNLPITDYSAVAAEIVNAGLLAEDEAREILDINAPPSGEIGYPEYMGRNALAKIRRLKQRIAGIEALRAAPPVEHRGRGWSVRTGGGQVQIHFAAGKPPEKIREILNRGAYKWSRYAGAWVRKYTIPARSATIREIIPAIEEAIK